VSRRRGRLSGARSNLRTETLDVASGFGFSSINALMLAASIGLLCQGSNVQRRDFIKLLSSAVGMWPFRTFAQQPVLPIIGYMSSRSASDSAVVVAAFRKGLSDAGFIEGQNVKIEYRWADGRYDRLPGIATELVRLGSVLLVTTGGEPSALAAKAATSSIPIVFTTGGDPVKIGLVASLNRPGGNATGVSLLTTAPESKRLGLLREMAPGTKLVGVLIDPNYQEAEAQAQELREAAGRIDQRIHIAFAGNDSELESAFETLVQAQADAVLVCADPFFDTRADRIVGFATQHRMPGVYQFREYALRGGLMSYGISLAEGYRQVGVYAAQVLKGAKPADLPIVQSIKFEFVINLKTAKILGLEVPPMLLARADEVIE
jgi:putative tryptophan/tyrosine transport system substrate-binding protein